MMQVRAFSRTQEILRYILSDMGDAVIVGQEAKVTDTDRIVLAKLAVIAFSTCSENAESDTPDFAPKRARVKICRKLLPIAAITVVFIL